MILLIFIWICIFFIFFILGFSVDMIIRRISGQTENEHKGSFDEYFFLGFMSLSPFIGILSIFMPVGTKVLLFVSAITIILFAVNFKEIVIKVKSSAGESLLFKRTDLVLIILLILFLLSIAVQTITWSDTGLYHAQFIQWIRKFAVVPGLGNIHGRFAFNSMFHVISALFTFHINDIVIFPLNGLCYTILIIKLFTLSLAAFRIGYRWETAFYILILLSTLFIMTPLLNSASPDIICGILVIYTFILLLNKKPNGNKINYSDTILLSLIVLNCVTYKISSLFLVLAFLPGLNKDFIKKSAVILIVCLITLTPFIIRNYYLSGYLVYPFPAINIFNVDWKIPYAKAVDEKLWVVSWARNVPFQDVTNLKITDWIVPWFKSNTIFNKCILIGNLLSVFTLIIMFFRKDFLYATIQVIILVNLLFWFIMAPDTRFALGFLIPGFALTAVYLLKISEHRHRQRMPVLIILISCCLLIILYKRIYGPVNVLKNPSLFFCPASFETVKTKSMNAGFDYRVPLNGEYCYYCDIPCVPFPLTNVSLRGKDLNEGFRPVKVNQ